MKDLSERNNIITQENLVWEKINQKQVFLKQLVSTVSKFDVFSTNENDEFQIHREDGTTQGIFKCWAAPIIPFLELDKLNSFPDAASREGTFWNNINTTDTAAVEQWTKELSSKPAKLWETLEHWRGFSATQDKRLFSVFQNRPLPEDGDEKIAELYLRLFTAFGLSSPFYNIESMVGGANEISNPILFDNNEVDRGGALDLVAMALPSALESKVKATNLNWNNLNWDEITKDSKLDPHDPESLIAFRVSRALGIPIEDVIFAANALEFIPANVGGKKGDLPPEDAQEVINKVLTNKTLSHSSTVARDVNALIRFLNWVPMIKGVENFSGLGWQYASVCDTTNLLFSAFINHKPLDGNFQNTFESLLADQLKHLDASSARGRFLIQLFNENKIKPEIYNLVTQKSDIFFKEVSASLVAMELNEQTTDALEFSPRFMVGGKAAGLAEAAEIFGRHFIPESTVITTETIENWLKADHDIWRLTIELDGTSDINRKLAISSSISMLIKQKLFDTSFIEILSNGPDLFVVRSSSFDEDTDFNGTAAGIYESELPVKKENLNNAISNVISSFFSEKAVSYRYMQGLSDRPMFAVIISPFIHGVGGVAFSLGNKSGWEIVVSDNPTNVAGNKGVDFDSYKLLDGTLTKVVNKGFADENTVMNLGRMVESAEHILGHRVDVEFIIDDNNKLWILQLREIKDGKKSENRAKFSTLIDYNLNNLKDLDNPEEFNLPTNTRLILNENINIDQFQGTLFRWLTINHDSIREIVLPKRIARTSHFANICINLDIDLVFAENE